MKLSQFAAFTTLIAAVSARPVRHVQRQDSSSFDGLSFDQIDALTPQFGITAGTNPDGTGNCDGSVNAATGQAVKVPCACPPDRDFFIQDLINNLNAGHVINNPSVDLSFPSDSSAASIQARFNAATVTLQNFNGSGKGCPQAATTWSAQLAAALSGASSSAAGTTPATSPAPAAADPSSAVPQASTTSAATASSSATSGGSLSTSEIDALTPGLGFQAGVNPDGTGNCDGAVNGANGQPVQVPCACPPDRATFIQALSQDIAAGHAVNNPSVPFSFPTDNSTASQIARVQASLVALQNLNGTGKGCPAASTTLSSQLSALQAQQ